MVFFKNFVGTLGFSVTSSGRPCHPPNRGVLTLRHETTRRLDSRA